MTYAVAYAWKWLVPSLARLRNTPDRSSIGRPWYGMSVRSMATRCGRRRSARGTSAASARLSRRSNSSRAGIQASQPLRTVSRDGALASDRQAADSEHSRAQAANRTCSNVRAVQPGL